jgi:hypothetical protein
MGQLISRKGVNFRGLISCQPSQSSNKFQVSRPDPVCAVRAVCTIFAIWVVFGIMGCGGKAATVLKKEQTDTHTIKGDTVEPTTADVRLQCKGLPWACMVPTPSITLNGKNISAESAAPLQQMMKVLSTDEKEIYSKPEYTLEYRVGNESHIVSFFEKEAFVFNGPFLTAWDARMRGHSVSGFVLTEDVIQILARLANTIISKAAAAPSKTVAPPSWNEISAMVALPINTSARFQRFTKTTAVGPEQFVVVGGVVSKFQKLPRLIFIRMKWVQQKWQYDVKDIFDYKLSAKELKEYLVDCGRIPSAQVFLAVDDMDKDGTDEALVRHKLETCGDEHVVSDTRVVVLNLEETISTSLDVLGSHRTMTGEHLFDKQLQTRYDTDHNGDGHPDLAIRFEETSFLCNLGIEEHREEIRIYNWVPETDSYRFSNNQERTWQTEVVQ